MPTDYKALIEKTFTEWTELLAVSGGRMQTDADLFNLVKLHNHVLDVEGHEIANSIYIVLNDPGRFAWDVETALGSAVEQISVTSESRRFDTAYVENFIKVAYTEADKLNALKGNYPLNPFIDQQNCRRGSEAAMFYFHLDKGIVIPTLNLWDTGYFVASYDGKGLAATGYKSYRSKDQILAEYPDVKISEEKDIEVLYIMARDSTELYIAGDEVKKLPNQLGYVPVVYRRVPLGSMLMDRNSVKRQGESILFLLRDLVPELDRLVSIIQSLNLQELDHALQEDKTADGYTTGVIPTVDEVTKPGTINEVKGQGFTKMPIGEIRNQADLLHKMIQDRIDRAGLNNFQTLLNPKTATEIMAISQKQEVSILPRLANRGLLKQDGAEMIIKQIIDEAERHGLSDVKLGNQTFQVAKLRGEYKIEFKYSFKDPTVDAARQSMAVAQRGQRPDSWILRNTLMSDDPDEEERLLAAEKARRESRLVDLDWKITKLLEAADDGDPYAEDQAKELAIEWITIAKQEMSGMMAPPQGAEVKPQQPMLPQFATSAGGPTNAGTG